MTTDTIHIHNAKIHIDLAMKAIDDRIKQANEANKLLKRLLEFKVNKSQAAEFMGYSPGHLRRLARQYPQRLVFTDGKIKLADLAKFEQWYRTQTGVRYD